MTRYYRETETGDFMAVWFDHSLRTYKGDLHARSTAIAGMPSSVCTCNVSPDYLTEKCERVLKRDVPRVWLSWF